MEPEKNYNGNTALLDNPIQPISADKFADNFIAPVKPAVAEAGSTYVPPVQPDPPGEGGEPPAKPVFDPPPAAADPDGDDDISVKKWSKAELNDSLEMFLNFRSMAQAELLSMVSGEPGEKYELSEEAMNRLARVYAPYMKRWGGKIPDWVWLIAAEGIVMTPIVRGAIADRKVNRANAKLVGSPEVAATVKKATATQSGRRNYSLDQDGYYLMDAVTNLRLRKDLRQAKPKASIADLAKILDDNELETVKAIFPEWDLSAYA